MKEMFWIFFNQLKDKLQLIYNRFCELLYFKITKHDFLTIGVKSEEVK